MGDPRTVLYLSLTGALQPLGYSQVVRLLRSLSGPARRYVLVSMEREDDLSDTLRREALAAELEAARIRWVPRVYEGPARNMVTLAATALREAQRADASLLHARSYLAAGAARWVKGVRGTPYLFDKRGYWIDEKREAGRWFTADWSYALGKRAERALFEGAEGLVSLTRLGVEDVRAGAFGAWPASRPAVVIPTCVDYEAFTLEHDLGVVPEPIRRELEDKLVLGYIGSVNASYEVEAMCQLFARVRRRRADAHLLALTGQPEALAAALHASGVDVDADVTLTRAPHADMPAWMTLVDWGLLLLATSFAKRASMPTKLAEFFAAGVRPVQYGCNEEVTRWVVRAGSGLVLNGLEANQLEEAARRIARSPTRASREPSTWAMLERARRLTREHFSLATGLTRYNDLLDALL